MKQKSLSIIVTFVPTLILLTILFVGVHQPVVASPLAATINVPGGQPTIQAAINAAINGDVVLVASGTYVENINFLGKAIIVTSVAGPQVTIIDGNQLNSVVTFNSGEGQTSVLSGFSIQNGRSTFNGGGITIRNSSPTVMDNIIINNQAASGGGIRVNFGSPLIQRNIISGNTRIGGSGGGAGGGIYVGGAASAKIINNVIANNIWTSGLGGGILLFAAGTPVISDNIISGNSTPGSGVG